MSKYQSLVQRTRWDQDPVSSSEKEKNSSRHLSCRRRSPLCPRANKVHSRPSPAQNHSTFGPHFPHSAAGMTFPDTLTWCWLSLKPFPFPFPFPFPRAACPRFEIPYQSAMSVFSCLVLGPLVFFLFFFFSSPAANPAVCFPCNVQSNSPPTETAYSHRMGYQFVRLINSGPPSRRFRQEKGCCPGCMSS